MIGSHSCLLERATPPKRRAFGQAATSFLQPLLLLLVAMATLTSAVKAQIPAGTSGRVLPSGAFVSSGFQAVYAQNATNDAGYVGWSIKDSSGQTVASYSSSTSYADPGTDFNEQGSGKLTPTSSSTWSVRGNYKVFADGGCGSAEIIICVPQSAAAGTYTVNHYDGYNAPGGNGMTLVGSRSSGGSFTVAGSVSGPPSAPVLSIGGRSRYKHQTTTTLQWTRSSGTVLYKLKRSFSPTGPYVDVQHDDVAAYADFAIDRNGSLTSPRYHSSLPYTGPPFNTAIEPTRYYVVVAVNSYGESQSNEVHDVNTSCTYISQGQSSNVPAVPNPTNLKTNWLSRRWIIKDQSGNVIAQGNNGATVNGWTVTYNKGVYYVPDSYEGLCPPKPVPAHNEPGVVMSVTAPIGALPLPEYYVQCIGEYPNPQYYNNPNANPTIDDLDGDAYFDVTGTATLYRMYNSPNDFLTWNLDEIATITQPGYGWTVLGAVGYVVGNEFTDTGLIPVYRSTHPNGDKLFTASLSEVAYAKTVGYIPEGIMFYLYPTGGGNRRPVYRFYDLNTGRHFCNTDPNEFNNPPPGLIPEFIIGYTAF